MVLLRYCSGIAPVLRRCCSGIAPVLRRCCDGVGPLSIPCTTLIYPLYMPCSPFGLSACLHSRHRQWPETLSGLFAPGCLLLVGLDIVHQACELAVLGV